MTLKTDFMKEAFVSSLGGIPTTLALTFITLLVSFPLAFLMAKSRIEKKKVSGRLVSTYVSVIRGTPVVLQILFLYSLLPSFLNFVIKDSERKTYKLKFGHRGGNHPVKNLETGKLEITSQNHSYAVDAKSLEGTGLTTTHINLLDNTIEGVESVKDRIFSVQYHPESAPGPQDSAYLFDKFINLMKNKR